MSNDIDFEQFIKLLDGALASDDKNVKQALRKFLFVAAMVMGDDTEPGPFTEMMDTIDSLQQRLAALEAQLNPTTSVPSQWTYPNWGTTNIGTGTGVGTSGGGFSTGNTTASTGSTITYTNPTSTTGTITLPNTTTASSSTTTYAINPGATVGSLWYNTNDPKTGTGIKEEIKKGLDKLAK